MLQIDLFILLAQLINFAILYYVFKRFIASKVHQRILARKEELKQLEMADEHYKEKMTLAEQERQEMLENARKTSRNLMKESEVIAKAQAKAIEETAHAQAIAILDGGKQEIEKERRSMLTQMKSHIIDVSLKLNEKMFGNTINSREFLEQELEKMK